MKDKDQRLEREGDQTKERMHSLLKSAVATVVILASIKTLQGANSGNMMLSLAWPILLFPLFSAFRELCELLARCTGELH
jgi:hypothetical protein